MCKRSDPGCDRYKGCIKEEVYFNEYKGLKEAMINSDKRRWDISDYNKINSRNNSIYSSSYFYNRNYTNKHTYIIKKEWIKERKGNSSI